MIYIYFVGLDEAAGGRFSVKLLNQDLRIIVAALYEAAVRLSHRKSVPTKQFSFKLKW